MSLDLLNLLICGVQSYEESRCRRPRVLETENDTGIDARQVGFQAQLAADLIKAEITITDLQRSVALDVHSQDGLDKPCDLRASSKAGEIGLGIGKHQCSQDSGLSKALMWARVSSAIARIAIEGGAPKRN